MQLPILQALAIVEINHNLLQGMKHAVFDVSLFYFLRRILERLFYYMEFKGNVHYCTFLYRK